MLAQEREGEKWKPTVIELGSIGTRHFALTIYYNLLTLPSHYLTMKTGYLDR
jgi:hypothetical protein